MTIRLGMVATLLCLICSSASAAVKTKLARETAEYVLQKFSKEAAGEGLETLSGRIAALTARHGDEAALAVRKVGPRAIRLIDDAGPHGSDAARLLARYGDEATWVVAKPQRLALGARLGDDATEAMMKHGEIAEPLLKEYGTSAASALKGLTSQNSRRLAMLSQEGELAAIGKTPELLGIVSRYGDRAMEFIWKNKASLAVATALTAFLTNPEPFLNGAKDITAIAAENVAKPLVDFSGQVATEIARNTNWTVILLVLGSFGIGGLAIALYRRRKPLRI